MRLGKLCGLFVLLVSLPGCGGSPGKLGKNDRVGQVFIVGNSLTPDAMIREQLTLYPGLPLDPADLRDSERRLQWLNVSLHGLRGLGKVSIQVLEEETPTTYRDIVIHWFDPEGPANLPDAVVITDRPIEGVVPPCAPCCPSGNSAVRFSEPGTQ